MATVQGGAGQLTDEDIEQQKTLSEGIAPTAQAGAGGSPMAANRKANRFANIQSYLGANKAAGEAMAGGVATDLTAGANKARTALQMDDPSYRVSVSQGTFTEGKRNDLESAIKSGDLGKLRGIGQYLAGGSAYQGPSGAGAYGGVERAIKGLGEKADLAKTSGGMQQLLGEKYGGKASGLDSALAGRYGGDKLGNAISEAGALAKSGNELAQGAGGVAEGATSASQAQANLLQGNIGGLMKDWDARGAKLGAGNPERAKYEALSSLLGRTPTAAYSPTMAKTTQAQPLIGTPVSTVAPKINAAGVNTRTTPAARQAPDPAQAAIASIEGMAPGQISADVSHEPGQINQKKKKDVFGNVMGFLKGIPNPKATPQKQRF